MVCVVVVVDEDVVPSVVAAAPVAGAMASVGGAMASAGAATSVVVVVSVVDVDSVFWPQAANATAARAQIDAIRI